MMRLWMKRLLTICGIATVVLGGCASAIGSSSGMPRIFLDGIRHYEAGDFSEAVDAFSQIAEAGISNGDLFYNLGNAHLKNDDLGHAILWYERALRLSPANPDLKFNHEYALSKTLDEREAAANPFIDVLLFWKDLLGEAQIRWVAIGLNMAVWIMLAVHLLVKRRFFAVALPTVAVLALVFFLAALYDYYDSAHRPVGVILPEAVSVRSGYSGATTELFTLHAGTTVRIERKADGFCRIRFAEGKIGWLRQSDIGII